jgi:hypothetical protein
MPYKLSAGFAPDKSVIIEESDLMRDNDYFFQKPPSFPKKCKGGKDY